MDNEMVKLNKYDIDNLGFTLIELLIGMAITSIVSAGIFAAFNSQQKIHIAQKQSVEMQQNLRVALLIMTSDIRMAGYDPSGSNGAGIVNDGDGSDRNNRFIFTYFNADAAGDGNNNDNDTSTSDADETLQAIEFYLYDSLGDGTIDLGRRNGARLDAIAENISNLQFVYLDVYSNPTAIIDDIRAVQITIQVTTDANERSLNNDRSLTTTVKFRNLGL